MDPIALQKQIKDNAEDLQTYLRDLSNWEADIKKKDAELRGVDVDEESYPAIRSKAARMKNCDDNILIKEKNHAKKKKISGYDYASWDKLDIDKVCEEIDVNEAKRLRESALYEKEMGNNYVKAGNWEKAITCYTKAIKCCQNDPIFYANRALCYLKIKDFHNAEYDCTKAIKLDADYVKAWLRRYAAREGLGKLEMAKCDLLRVLTLEPRNAEARSKLAALEIQLKEQEEEMNYRRIEVIEEMNEKKLPRKEGDEETIDKRMQEVAGAVQSVNSSGDKCIPPWKISTVNTIQPIHKAPHLRSKKPLRRVPVEDDLDQGLEEGEGDASLLIRAQPKEDKDSILQNVPPIIQKERCTEILEPYPPELPSLPKTSIQFLLAWKAIKMFPDLAVKYLQKIPPDSLSSIFGDSLETSTLEEILNMMAHKEWNNVQNEEPSTSQKPSNFEFLRSLSNVPRFTTLAMFLPSDEKIIARELLALSVKNGECSKEEATDVALKFML